MLGWIFNITAFKEIFPGELEMMFSTACLFVMCGACLWLSNGNEASRWRARTALAIAAMITGLAALTLCEYLTGRSFGIDGASFHDVTGALVSGRMAPQTALVFALIGIALFLLCMSGGGRKKRKAAAMLTFASLILSILALAGHLYDATYIYRISPKTGMALHSCLAFVLLSLGIFFKRSEGTLVQILESKDSGGVMLRRLLPSVFVLPLLLGWIVVEGQEHGFYDVEGRACILVTVQIIFLFYIVRSSGRLLHKLDQQRACAYKKREILLAELQTALSEIKQLSGMLPICAHCKHIRDDNGYWKQIEVYIQEHSAAKFSHGICENCLREHYPDVAESVLCRCQAAENADSKLQISENAA